MKTLSRSVFASMAITFIGVQAAYAGGAGQAAQQAVSQAVMVAAVSSAGAEKFSVPCTKPGGQAACVLMGLSLAQIPLALMTGSGASKSKSDLTTSNSSYAGTDATDLSNQPSTYTLQDGSTLTGQDAKTANALAANGLGSLAESYAKNAQTFEGTGIKVSDDGQSVTLPNGKKVASSDMSSADGMRNAGFSSAEISAAQDVINDLQKNQAATNAKVAALTNDVGGGGGGGLGSRGGGGELGSGAGDASLYGKFGLKAKSDKSAVSGMSKKFGNDNIGVAGDDIFEMVSRRYQSKDKVDTFLKN